MEGASLFGVILRPLGDNMSAVSYIIDALRRLGSSTQKSAIARQDAQLKGKDVLGRSQTVIRSPEGDAEVFIATIAPTHETVEVLSSEEVRPILNNVDFGVQVLEDFGLRTGKSWTLNDLDKTFELWLQAEDRRGYSDEAIVELLGAMFGHYCATHLKMRWIKLTDAYGSVLAVEGVDREFKTFPYQVIAKRIAAKEYGFFRPVFAAVRHQSLEASVRGTTT